MATPREDTAFFLSLLRPGDLVEFERDGYQHWAVFIGQLVIVMVLSFLPMKGGFTISYSFASFIIFSDAQF